MFVVWRNNPPLLMSDKLPKNFATLSGEMKVYISYYDVEITVPKGFITDGASVPPVFDKIVKRWGAHKYCDVVHDYLYSNKKFSRAKSDNIYGILLLNCEGISKIKALSMFIAVRLFGASRYNK